MIANISGSSGSGKTTLANHLLNQYPLIYRSLISYTSRFKRPNEKEDINYHFVNESFFYNKNDFVLQRVRGDGFYAVKRNDLTSIYGEILLTTFPPKGVLILEELGLSVKCFYLSVSSEERKKRMLKRGDKLVNIKKRLVADDKESTLEIVKSILTTRPIFILDGHKSLDEISLLFHETLFNQINNQY